jgi:hypothetical protein
MRRPWPIPPRRRFGYLLIAAVVVLLFEFLSGPSGLVSIMIRRHRLRHLQADIVRIKDRIAERSAQRRWLSDPDSARLLARELLAPLPDTTGPNAPH